MKLTAVPLVFATTLHAIPRLAQPIVSAKEIPTSEISLHSDNNVPRDNNLRSSSSPSDILFSRTLLSDSHFNVTGLNDYVYPVPQTDLILTITLGARLDGSSLAVFLDATEDVLVQAISRLGKDTGSPKNIFEFDLGEDLEFVAESLPALSQRLTWTFTKDTIAGLQQFLIQDKRYREASCRVNRASGDKAYLGSVDLRKRTTPPRTNLVRSLPHSPSSKKENITLAVSVGVNPNVHIDFHPAGFSRLDFRDVLVLLAVTKDWAQEAIKASSPNNSIDHGEFLRSLGDGVQIGMSAAPKKRLTYGLVLETLDRLEAWTWTQHKKGRVREVEFGILENGIVKGSGSIKKDSGRRMNVAR